MICKIFYKIKTLLKADKKIETYDDYKNSNNNKSIQNEKKLNNKKKHKKENFSDITKLLKALEENNNSDVNLKKKRRNDIKKTIFLKEISIYY